MFKDDAAVLARVLATHVTQGDEFDVQALFTSLTFDSFCKLAYGVEMNALQEVAETGQRPAFLKAFDDCTGIAGRRWFNMFWLVGV